MNENADNKQIENILRKAHLPEPSPGLKERITAEARKTWTQIPSELPWQTPVRRLIVSAAAAVLIIWLTNSSSDYALVRWRSGGSSITLQHPTNLDALPELSYRPLARHLVSSGRKPSITNASALRNYTETMLRVLSEAQQNGDSKSSAPAESRSDLLIKQSGLNSYS